MKKGWQIRKLGDVCAFDKAQGIHRGLPYVGLEHIESHSARFIGSSEAQPVKSSTFRFSDEHVLYGRLRPYLNKALAPDFEGHCSTEIFPLKPSPELSREYLLFWLLADATCDRINATCTGARMPRAQMNDVLDFQLPVPPLAEQQRIVGLLDEAFAGLATAKANAEKNLQNARALFESYHDSIFRLKCEGWAEKPLGEVCEYVNGKAHEKCIDEGGRFIVINSKFISTEGKVFKRSNDALMLLQPDEIAMVLSDVPNGKALAKCYLVEEADTYTLNQRICLIRSTKFHPKFLFYQLNRNRHFLSFDNGGNQTNMRLNQVLSCPLFLPPLAEQENIADTLDALSAETQRLARLYERKHAALEALKKSLLHQAFSGEL
ncbi:MAG: restriction endonuclease subunit S [Nitrospirae bacterium]|nr:restriction endonuclease subunit S [Nitrospirota bacterium]MDA1303210.1 restriction endonuclease subunit S [Nitrospirota bacterium]